MSDQIPRTMGISPTPTPAPPRLISFHSFCVLQAKGEYPEVPIDGLQALTRFGGVSAGKHQTCAIRCVRNPPSRIMYSDIYSAQGHTPEPHTCATHRWPNHWKITVLIAVEGVQVAGQIGGRQSRHRRAHKGRWCAGAKTSSGRPLQAWLR